MQKIIRVSDNKKQHEDDKAYWLSKSPEFRLDAMEKLRIEAGKFLYEYPGRLQRVIRVTGKKQR